MDAIRILYSFPHRIGANRICHTAWQQAEYVAKAGAKVVVSCGSIGKDLSSSIRVICTLSLGGIRVPTRILGRERYLSMHDWLTARWLNQNHKEIDLVHVWPGSAKRTIRTAKKLNIPCVLERPNAHTEYAFQAADDEAKYCGVSLPKDHDHAFDEKRLKQEVEEYNSCDFLLCPSEFVEKTFLDRGVSKEKIQRHRYGFDPNQFYPNVARTDGTIENCGFTALYAGVCEPRKGLHYLLKAWFQSGAYRDCRLKICGEFVPKYREHLTEFLEHPSIEVLGHRNDLPDLMRSSDIFVLSSVEEGSALVTYEAMASGCVLLVSDATGAPCKDGYNGLVHEMRDVDELARHLNLMRENINLRESIRDQSIRSSCDLTWEAAGGHSMKIYREVLARQDTASSLDE